jgi:hypothetical protein
VTPHRGLDLEIVTSGGQRIDLAQPRRRLVPLRRNPMTPQPRSDTSYVTDDVGRCAAAAGRDGVAIVHDKRRRDDHPDELRLAFGDAPRGSIPGPPDLGPAAAGARCDL